jgi:hypothetical protein
VTIAVFVAALLVCLALVIAGCCLWIVQAELKGRGVLNQEREA